MKTFNFRTKCLLLSFVFINQVLAICPGFNYAIGNVIPLGDGINRCKRHLNFDVLYHPRVPHDVLCAGNVYDDSCDIVDGLTTNENPCDQGIFGCSPPPILFDEYTNSFTGLR